MADRDQIFQIARQALPVLVLCAFIEFGAGSMLGGIEGELASPGILIMVPPLLGLRGNIGGALASRLGTGLHRGVIDPDKILNPEIINNLEASIFLTVTTSTAVGVLAFGVTVLTGLHSFTLSLLTELVSIALVASLISNLGLMMLTVIVSIFSFKRGWDPDNITGPIITTIGDLFTVVSIYIGVLLVM